eukprot:m.1366554 g.1366554  ORF g.1366554 m.1366554 type:complete len:307 (-) comp24952_c0_seq15:1428-2348(-)
MLFHPQLRNTSTSGYPHKAVLQVIKEHAPFVALTVALCVSSSTATSVYPLDAAMCSDVSHPLLLFKILRRRMSIFFSCFLFGPSYRNAVIFAGCAIDFHPFCVCRIPRLLWMQVGYLQSHAGFVLSRPSMLYGLLACCSALSMAPVATEARDQPCGRVRSSAMDPLPPELVLARTELKAERECVEQRGIDCCFRNAIAGDTVHHGGHHCVLPTAHQLKVEPRVQRLDSSIRDVGCVAVAKRPNAFMPVARRGEIAVSAINEVAPASEITNPLKFHSPRVTSCSRKLLAHAGVLFDAAALSVSVMAE